MGSIITLTTDFGTGDGFVGQMKGVVLGINPGVTVVDITHDIEPFAVLAGALTVGGVFRRFPRGTIHVAVVDPGVGSERRAIAIRCEDRMLVGPDNGLFEFVFRHVGRSCEIREIVNEEFMLRDPHPTFHGRDVFAPTAARLSLGRRFEALGDTVEEIVRLDIPTVERTGDGLEGRVIHVDTFGSLVTNIEATMLNRQVGSVESQGLRAEGLKRFFDEVEIGRPLAVINSFGLLELAVNRGSAAEIYGIGCDARVRVLWSQHPGAKG